MKRVIAIIALVAMAAPAGAAAQTAATTATTRPLADVAKDEEARRKSVRTPARIYTNSDLRPDTAKVLPPPMAGSPDASANATPSGNTSPTAPAADTPPAAAKDQAYWSGRLKELQTALQRNRIFADSLQSRINALTTEYVNRDDPAQRDKVQADRNTALAELERVNQEIKDQTKAIADLHEEARKAGVPSGWLRPGA